MEFLKGFYIGRKRKRDVAFDDYIMESHIPFIMFKLSSLTLSGTFAHSRLLTGMISTNLSRCS